MLGVCLQCGRIKTWYKDSTNVCDSCGGFKAVSTGLEWDDSIKMSPEEKEKWRQNIRETMFFNNPHFSERLWKQELRNAEKRQRTTDRMVAKAFPNEAPNFQASQNKEVKCPRCNSTQIQLVQRKWGLLTGFLTNKVDRVCVSCKTKFQKIK